MEGIATYAGRTQFNYARTAISQFKTPSSRMYTVFGADSSVVTVFLNCDLYNTKRSLAKHVLHRSQFVQQ